MGFDFSKYEGGGSYLNAAEKKAVAEAGIPFVIKSIREGAYDGEPRYELTVSVPNPETGEAEERILAFPIGSGVESRDRMLEALMAYLAEDGADEVKAKLDKVGRSYIIRQA